MCANLIVKKACKSDGSKRKFRFRFFRFFFGNSLSLSIPISKFSKIKSHGSRSRKLVAAEEMGGDDEDKSEKKR